MVQKVASRFAILKEQARANIAAQDHEQHVHDLFGSPEALQAELEARKVETETFSDRVAFMQHMHELASKKD